MCPGLKRRSHSSQDPGPSESSEVQFSVSGLTLSHTCATVAEPRRRRPSFHAPQIPGTPRSILQFIAPRRVDHNIGITACVKRRTNKKNRRARTDSEIVEVRTRRRTTSCRFLLRSWTPDSVPMHTYSDTRAIALPHCALSICISKLLYLYCMPQGPFALLSFQSKRCTKMNGRVSYVAR